MSPRDKKRFLRERGWLSSSYNGQMGWLDPQDRHGSGNISTNDAYDRETSRCERKNTESVPVKRDSTASELKWPCYFCGRYFGDMGTATIGSGFNTVPSCRRCGIRNAIEREEITRRIAKGDK